ncbi:MAG: MMPL family transporter [Opitutaceae bacterium]|nr:MMPL family transporter [Verrucomicrobiales bacterium]
MTSHKESLLVRALRWLADSVCRRPHLFFYPQIILFILGVLYVCGFLIPGQHLRFDTHRSSLVGADKKYHRIYQEFRQEFPGQDDIVVVVESEAPEKNRQFVERLGVKLEAETNFFTDVFYKGDLKMMGRKALMFVPDDKLRELRQTLEDYKPFIRQFTNATSLASLFSQINSGFLSARRASTNENESMVKALPALERIVNQATDSFLRSGQPPSPGVTALFGEGGDADRGMYITFGRGRLYLVTAKARNAEVQAEAANRLRQIVEQTRFEVPGVNVGVTGEPILEVDEMKQSQMDSTLASILSLIVCALIFISGYRATGRPLKATACLIVGIGYTITYTTLVVGHLNILTITFVPILIGLAIDFGVHLVTRYEEELRRGETERVAIERAMVNTGLGIFTGALTTSAAFFAMSLTDFKGVQEMGLICGGGLLVCLIPMMTMLPVLLLRGRQNVIDHSVAGKPDARARIERLWLDRPVATIVAGLVVCGLAIIPLRHVYFDYNLLHMQSKGLPAVVFEHKLIDSASKSVLFGAVVARTSDEAARLEEQLLKLPAVAGVDSMSKFLAEDQSAKLAVVREIKQNLALISFADIDPAPVDLSLLSRVLWSLYGYCGFAAETIRNENPEAGAEVAEALLSLRKAIGRLRVEMLRGDPVIRERLTRFQEAFLTDIRKTFQELKEQDDSAGLKASDLPAPLRNRFIGITGKYLLQVYPKEDVWERKHQEEFVRQLRTVAENATGTPVQLYEYTSLLKSSYEKAAWYALTAIAIMVLIHFRSITCLLLALMPVFLGFLWMLGLMGFAGIPFNPANIMTLPLVIGIGVTNGIHILNRFAEEQNPGILAMSTGKAVLVSGLTTVAGFGSLIIAKHQGIASLGFIMSVGVSTCMLAGLTLLPALLTLMISAGWRIKKPSDDNARSSLGSEEPR